MKKKYQYDYPRPALTVDTLLVAVRDAELQVLLIQRKHPPFKNRWALPGGFVNEGEKLRKAAQRELKEETGMVAKHLVPFGTYGDPGRDPRGWTVTVGYLGIVHSKGMKAEAGDDAASVKWFSIDRLPKLAFDHDRIIAEGLEFLRGQLAIDSKQAKELLGKSDVGLLREVL